MRKKIIPLILLSLYNLFYIVNGIYMSFWGTPSCSCGCGTMGDDLAFLMCYLILTPLYGLIGYLLSKSFILTLGTFVSSNLILLVVMWLGQYEYHFSMLIFALVFIILCFISCGFTWCICKLCHLIKKTIIKSHKDNLDENNVI